MADILTTLTDDNPREIRDRAKALDAEITEQLTIYADTDNNGMD